MAWEGRPKKGGGGGGKDGSGGQPRTASVWPKIELDIKGHDFRGWGGGGQVGRDNLHTTWMMYYKGAVIHNPQAIFPL